jgi:hypothetical protein
MKEEYTTDPKEITLRKDTKNLWVDITGTIPVERKYKEIPEDDQDYKIFAITAQLGSNPYGEQDTWYFKNVTDTKKAMLSLEYLLHKKEQITKLWNILNCPANDQPEHRCPICGKHIDAYYSPSLKVCRKNHTPGNPGYGMCSRVRESMVNWLRKWHNKIEKAERIFICKNCGKEYTPTRSDSIFCSLNCRVASFRKLKKGVD